MRDFEILEHLGLWEEKTLFERAPPDLIREKSCEPYDDGRSLPLVVYALQGCLSGCSTWNRRSASIEPEYKDCNFRPKDWYAFLPGFCVVYEWYLVDQPDFMLTGCPVLHY
jgi:hypothetical protein